jgi:hypothetical protein
MQRHKRSAWEHWRRHGALAGNPRELNTAYGRDALKNNTSRAANEGNNNRFFGWNKGMINEEAILASVANALYGLGVRPCASTVKLIPNVWARSSRTVRSVVTNGVGIT